MQSDPHERLRLRIEKWLAGECTAEDEETLPAHLDSCVDCQRSLLGSERVIATLQAFSFEVDPALEAKVVAVVQTRAKELQAAPSGWQQPLWIFLIAVVLTIGGSVLDLQFSNLLGMLLDIGSVQARHALVDLWIVPSIFVLLLFPLLPLLSNGREPGTERNL